MLNKDLSHTPMLIKISYYKNSEKKWSPKSLKEVRSSSNNKKTLPVNQLLNSTLSTPVISKSTHCILPIGSKVKFLLFYLFIIL